MGDLEFKSLRLVCWSSLSFWSQALCQAVLLCYAIGCDSNTGSNHSLPVTGRLYTSCKLKDNTLPLQERVLTATRIYICTCVLEGAVLLSKAAKIRMVNGQMSVENRFDFTPPHMRMAGIREVRSNIKRIQYKPAV